MRTAALAVAALAALATTVLAAPASADPGVRACVTTTVTVNGAGAPTNGTACLP